MCLFNAANGSTKCFWLSDPTREQRWFISAQHGTQLIWIGEGNIVPGTWWPWRGLSSPWACQLAVILHPEVTVHEPGQSHRKCPCWSPAWAFCSFHVHKEKALVSMPTFFFFCFSEKASWDLPAFYQCLESWVTATDRLDRGALFFQQFPFALWALYAGWTQCSPFTSILVTNILVVWVFCLFVSVSTAPESCCGVV